MSLISPPESPGHFTDPIDIKDDGDSPLNTPENVVKSTVLIATVEKDEPVVTRKELWSYYRTSFPRLFLPS